MTIDQPTPDQPGLHGIDFDGFLAVFCERENLLAAYPHVCPETDADVEQDREMRQSMNADGEP